MSHHVNSNVESNLSGSIQSEKDRQNLLSATKALKISNETTYSTFSRTQNNVTTSNTQTNSNIPSIQRNEYVPNIPIFNLNGPSSRRNGIGSKTYYTPHYERKPLSGLTSDAWEKYRAKYPTPKHFPKKRSNKIEYTQLHKKWLRIVSIKVDRAGSNESSSSSKPRKVQRTTDGQRNTAGITNSQSNMKQRRRVNRDVTKSQISAQSSPSKRLERRSKSRRHTPPSSSNQAHPNHRRSTSSVNNIHEASSQIEPIPLNVRSYVRARYQSNKVVYPMDLPTLHYSNLNSDQSSTVSISTSSGNSATQDTTFASSSIATNSSNRAQLLIDLDDFGTNTEDRSLPVPLNSSNEVSLNPGNHVTEIIQTPPLTNASVINEPEALEVIIRSRNNADYNIVISNPTIIQMHTILQRSILSLNSTDPTANNTILYQQVNNYMQVLRSTILSTDTNSSNISSLMSISVPRSLTIDESLYPLLDNTSEMPPIVIINRIQNGCVIKELTNCSICLEENNGNVLLEPCKHDNMCGTCVEKLTTWICPICRSHITRINVYV